MLLGRTSELRYLNNYYDREGSQILVVYGQKQIGKTTLVRKFAEGKPGYYYHARACSEREQVYQWGRQLARDGYEMEDFPSFRDILVKSVYDGFIPFLYCNTMYLNIVTNTCCFLYDIFYVEGEERFFK